MKIRNKNININSIQNIQKLYNIKSIKENYTLCKNNTVILIYEVTPLLITDNIDDVFNNISIGYMEFLKSMVFDFKIYIENTNYSVNYSVNSINEEKNKLKIEYLDNLQKLISETNIYYKKFYIIVTLNNISYIDEVDRYIAILKTTGVKLKKLSNEKEIENVLVSSMNRRESCIQK